MNFRISRSQIVYIVVCQKEKVFLNSLLLGLLPIYASGVTNLKILACIEYLKNDVLLCN